MLGPQPTGDHLASGHPAILTVVCMCQSYLTGYDTGINSPIIRDDEALVPDYHHHPLPSAALRLLR